MTRRNFLAGGLALAGTRGQGQASKRPNILFVIADDWGSGHAGVFGSEWINTPNVDRVARDGVVFTHCFTSNPKCSPCRASILTGRNTWQLKEAVSHYSIFPNEFPVYPAVLEKAGYFVGLTGKGWGPGDFKSTGFAHNPAGRPWSKRTNPPPHRGISSVDYAGNFEDFLAARPAHQPFCFWLGTQEPHRAYEEGAGARAGKQASQVRLPKFYPDSDLIRSDYLDYALEVEWFDRHLGRALDKLQAIGELDNTIVVVTSDHGEPFPRVKGQIYERGFHVPLIIRWGSRAKGGRTVADFINVRDFAPTFLEAAGVAAPTTVTGRSFLKSLTADGSGIIDASRDVMLTGKERHDLGRPYDAGYPVRAIRTREWLYVRNFEPDRWPAGNPETGYRNVDDSPSKTFLISSFDDYYRMSFGKRPAEELYDIRKDPDCVDNLARKVEFESVKRKLRDRMFEMLKEEGDPRVLGRADFFDTIQYHGPRKHSWDAWLKSQNP